jgi:hypothetical protein
MKYILLLSASLILLSCSKTKKVEKNIIGSWNVSEVYLQTTITSQTTNQSNDTTAYNLEGSFEFYKNGTGKFDVPDLSSSVNLFNWSNDADNIYLTSSANNNIDTVQIIESSKNKLILFSKQSAYSSSGLETYIFRYTLTK